MSRVRVTSTLTSAVLAYSFMQMMVVPALPAIQADLEVGREAVVWLLSAFLVSTAVGTPILGRLGDMYGKERMLIVVLAIFAVGGVVGALATSLPALIVARALQGLAGAVFPLSYGLARDTLPPRHVPLAIGVLSGSFGIGAIAGLVLSGLLVDHLAWQAMFWFGLLMPAIAIASILAFIPDAQARTRVRLDWVGATLLGAGVLAPLLALSLVPSRGWLAPAVLALLVAGVAILVAWARWELAHDAPFVELRLLARRTAWTVNVATVLIGFGMYANGYLIPQFVQADPAATGYGFGATVTEAAMFLAPAMLIGVVAGPASAVMARRWNARTPLLVGALTMCGGFVLLAVAHDAPWEIYVGVALNYGLGLNLALAAMGSLIVLGAPAGHAAGAGGINTMMRTLGGALGSQVVATIVAGGGGSGVDAFATSFWLCAALLAVAVAVTVASPAVRRT